MECGCLARALGRRIVPGVAAHPAPPASILPGASGAAQWRAECLNLHSPHAARPDEHQINVVSALWQLEVAIDRPAVIQRGSQLLDDLFLALLSHAVTVPGASVAAHE